MYYSLKFNDFHKFKSMSGDKTKYSRAAFKYYFLSHSFVKLQTVQQTDGKYKEDKANGTFGTKVSRIGWRSHVLGIWGFPPKYKMATA